MFAYETGLDDSAVQLLGDWSSSAFKTYLEFSFVKKVSISECIANNFDTCIKNLKCYVNVCKVKMEEVWPLFGVESLCSGSPSREFLCKLKVLAPFPFMIFNMPK